MILDLSMSIDGNTPVYPGDPQQVIEQLATIEKNGWNEKRITFNSHFSTHIDAPAHMLENGKTLTDYPIQKFIGTAVAIDVQGQREIAQDLKEVREGDIVFFITGHSKNSKNYFENNPVITEETAKMLIQKKVSIIGLDSFTPDNEPFPVHKMLLKEDILIVENLINLEQLSSTRFECHIMPLKIQGADGAPCRVVAITQEN